VASFSGRKAGRRERRGKRGKAGPRRQRGREGRARRRGDARARRRGDARARRRGDARARRRGDARARCRGDARARCRHLRRNALRIDERTIAVLCAQADALLSSGLLQSPRRDEAARVLDRVLVPLCRGQAIFSIAIAEGLADLVDSGALGRLTFARVEDYGREVLGKAESTTQVYVQIGKAVRTRPILRAALWSGALTLWQAQAILKVAHGDAEAAWVALAIREPVRAIKEKVRAVTGEAPDEEQAWRSVLLMMTPEQMADLDAAMALAGMPDLAGPAAPPWARLRTLVAEYRGHFEPLVDREAGGGPGRAGHAQDVDPGQGRDAAQGRGRDATQREAAYQRWCESWKRALEGLDPVPRMKLPGDLDRQRRGNMQARQTARSRHRRLKQLAQAQHLWEVALGPMLRALVERRLWKELCAKSLGDYCTDRLGLTEATVRRRVRLEIRLARLPALRAAFASGEISYTKAREVAADATPENEEVRVAEAKLRTCADLRRAKEKRAKDRHRAKGEAAVSGPAAMMDELWEAIELCQHLAAESGEGWIPPAEALRRIARHYLETWWGHVLLPEGPLAELWARKDGLCWFPGCTRAAAHGHHIVFASHGGADDPWNRLPACVFHHLNSIHGGWARVTGRTDTAVRVEAALEDGRPLWVYEVRPDGVAAIVV
jgi:hypothetical protein